MASLAVHFERLAWMTSFDVEPLLTLETKRRWQKWALETNALLIFPHDAIHASGPPHAKTNAVGCPYVRNETGLRQSIGCSSSVVGATHRVARRMRRIL